MIEIEKLKIRKENSLYDIPIIFYMKFGRKASIQIQGTKGYIHGVFLQGEFEERFNIEKYLYKLELIKDFYIYKIENKFFIKDE